ncbi:host attachment protein [Paracoccus sp. 11-3]|uniref:Host attachment protein n=1 Tax=Paracoccus amoyensis TaxID=2760093 RepID=A0A926G6A3_9RHOB|nr:host attachment family protein [Paracoccus amoyensis]MBC9245343.1 host attachment protein [Paracoccus amoyensis]
MLPHNTLVVVADGHSATLYRNVAKHGVELSEVEKLSPGDLDKQSAGAVMDEGSPRAEEEAGFAAQLAQYLNALALKHKYDDLAVAADPSTLGVMRKHYHKELQFRLRKELSKTLTNSDLAAIEAAFTA